MNFDYTTNVLNDTELFKLQEDLLGHLFPWRLSMQQGKESDTTDGPWFYHQFWCDKQGGQTTDDHRMDIINPVLKQLQYNKLLRIRANLLMPNLARSFSAYHVDQWYNCKNAIFYVTDNDGYTEFQNGLTFPSKANTLLKFDNDNLHRAVGPTDNIRILVNINYE
jgi:hypothetical protein